MFYYQTGEEVCLGDEIQYSEWQGMVEFIISPNTKPAQDYSAPNGGVMLLFFTGVRILLDTTDDEEDFIFLRRFNDSIPSKFEAFGQLCKNRYADGTPVLVGDEVEQCSGDGNRCKKHVVEVYPPFEQSSWDSLLPTGGVLLESEGETELMTAGGIPSSIHLLSRNSAK
ncbi:MAG: hypothetical protein IJR99_04805 [Kiritimatiellae bacterium]|nr:hypothetical protein [Kiritimatiellia bacterium]